MWERTREAPPAPKGSLFGAVALITGSTVGAGMLALPAVTAPAGLVPTAAALVSLWGLLTADALLLAEVNLACRTEAAAAAASARGGGGEEQGGGSDTIITLRQMAEATLGPAGKGE